MATAVASPPPMQSEAMPRLSPWCSSAFSSVTMTRAPDAPMGPAQRAGAAIHVRDVMAKPKVAHRRHGDDGESLVDFPQVDIGDGEGPCVPSAFVTEPMGAVGSEFGLSAKVAWPGCGREASSPPALGLGRAHQDQRRPPSEMDELFCNAPSRKAGRRVGILSSRALPGCSSIVTTSSALPARMATGVTSASKRPSLMAFCARVSEVMA